MEQLFAVCAPGLEACVARELYGLGLIKALGLLRDFGGVKFQGSLRDLYRANLLLRCADRILVRFAQFHAASFPELRRKASRLLWKDYLAPGRPVTLRVSCESSRLYHETAVAERLADAIADSLGTPPLPGPGQLIDVRLDDDLCSISLDSSGDPLHKRGYRLALAKAPLRETLASAMLQASGWDGSSPLLDPFCGSGTIAIEAALLAGRMAPGQARRFAFMDWPDFDAACWEELKAAAAQQAVSETPRIIASDRDAGAIRAAQANAKRAGVADRIEFSCRAVSAIEPPLGPGWVVTNPPYGMRLKGSGDLRDLYAQFGKVLRAKCPGWHASVLATGPRLMASTGLRFEPGFSTMNGGLQVKLANCLV
ncbi:MAG: class I SAM-dependent RNA methyltransferase [Elusimicrobia bacterium]|nr:class I SAM-dependent RNA methyltransferase [Elusimicrobiota bacterium]